MIRRLAPAGVVLAGLLLAGCANTTGTEVDYPQPAALESIPGSDLHKVVLTQLAATQLGVQTVPVAAVAGLPKGAAPETSIPLTALVYGPDGAPWTYQNIAALTYQREPLVIDHITSDTVVLRSGPPVGTPVVSVGGQELLGAEYGVGEE
ncbi:MAG TPA: hypothetical protein VJT31_42490 [Rugosimonospora sp.]|nr:hypothetical protein [Rugosimonospora sp.]